MGNELLKPKTHNTMVKTSIPIHKSSLQVKTYKPPSFFILSGLRGPRSKFLSRVWTPSNQLFLGPLVSSREDGELNLKGKTGRKRYYPPISGKVDKAIITLQTDGKRAYSFTLTPEETQAIRAKIHYMKKNPEKISFGVITRYNDRIEFYSYRDKFSDWWISVNMNQFKLDRDDWKKIFRIMNKIGHFLGLYKGKRRSKVEKS